MAYTPNQQSNLDMVMDFLNFINSLCPEIPRLNDVIANLDKMIKNNRIHFDSKTVNKHAPSSPAVTIDRKDTYVKDSFGSKKYDMSNLGDVADLVLFQATLTHEMFHILGYSDPPAFTESANLLKSIIDCIKKNRSKFDKKYGPKAMADFMIDQLEINEASERRSGQAKPPPKKCVIATATYGSEIAPEVQFLRNIRDNILKQMDWGKKFFDDYEDYYYKISPIIAEKMEDDPKLRAIVQWSIVIPWINYIKLIVNRPDWESLDMRGVEPELQAFLIQLRQDMDNWLSEIKLPFSFADHEPAEAVKELNVILNFVLRSGGLTYLHGLVKEGELPLTYNASQEQELLDLLREAGRVQKEIDYIMYGIT